MPVNHLITELKLNGITHPGVLDAMAHVPREKFVLSKLKTRAYDNVALPIEKEQTISQPYIVALMTQALFVHPHPQKILEVGTGSGYQAAILGTLFQEVWTIERIEKLHQKAQKVLNELGYDNIHCVLGDGTKGFTEQAPYDGIIVTAATSTIPAPLLEQLNPNGGVMVIPVGSMHQVQKLTLIKRYHHHYEKSILELVSFVPLIPDSN
ncbi:MAG: protein-L-isoaspartate(D-aspartate) O-methyltransferase [Proteobacteria bacterium]|nr:protein-L-isoaspartate(D-aspartate) O-methyltransferase [Pseudomonadota bacterium]